MATATKAKKATKTKATKTKTKEANMADKNAVEITLAEIDREMAETSQDVSWLELADSLGDAAKEVLNVEARAIKRWSHTYGRKQAHKEIQFAPVRKAELEADFLEIDVEALEAEVKVNKRISELKARKAAAQKELG